MKKYQIWQLVSGLPYFAVQAERTIEHISTGSQVGIDVGLKSYYTDSDGNTVDNPRFYRKAEKKLKRLHFCPVWWQRRRGC